MSARKELKIKKLGIIAGGGDLPRQLIQACKAHNIDYVVLGVKGHVDKIESDAVLRIGQASKILLFLKAHQVSDIVFIGSVKRPTIFTLWPDLMAFKFFIKAWINSFGDDSLLKGARKILEGEGFCVRGVHKFLPALLMPEGFLGKVQPAAKHQADIKLGLKEARAWGKADKGQAVLVKDGNIIAREDKKGTSAMIKKYGQVGAILVKTCKPQQDRDLDLPTLGLQTVGLCADQKMAGIVGHAGQTLAVDRYAMIEKADDANMFLMGVTLYD